MSNVQNTHASKVPEKVIPVCPNRFKSVSRRAWITHARHTWRAAAWLHTLTGSVTTLTLTRVQSVTTHVPPPPPPPQHTHTHGTHRPPPPHTFSLFLTHPRLHPPTRAHKKPPLSRELTLVPMYQTLCRKECSSFPCLRTPFLRH